MTFFSGNELDRFVDALIDKLQFHDYSLGLELGRSSQTVVLLKKGVFSWHKMFSAEFQMKNGRTDPELLDCLSDLRKRAHWTAAGLNIDRFLLKKVNIPAMPFKSIREYLHENLTDILPTGVQQTEITWRYLVQTLSDNSREAIILFYCKSWFRSHGELLELLQPNLVTLTSFALPLSLDEKNAHSLRYFIRQLGNDMYETLLVDNNRVRRWSQNESFTSLMTHLSSIARNNRKIELISNNENLNKKIEQQNFVIHPSFFNHDRLKEQGAFSLARAAHRNRNFIFNLLPQTHVPLGLANSYVRMILKVLIICILLHVAMLMMLGISSQTIDSLLMEEDTGVAEHPATTYTN